MQCAPVAQLDRATGYEPVGRVFESLRAHHSPLKYPYSYQLTIDSSVVANKAGGRLLRKPLLGTITPSFR